MSNGNVHFRFKGCSVVVFHFDSNRNSYCLFPCFISFLYLDLYLLGDNTSMS